jgi:hypothetical protein
LQQLQLMITGGEPYATGSSSQMARHIALAKEAWQPVANEQVGGSNKDATPSAGGSKRAPGGPLARAGLTPTGKVQVQPRGGYGRSYGAVGVATDVRRSAIVGAAAAVVGTNSAGAGTVSTNGALSTAVLAGSAQSASGVLSPGVFDLSKRLSINKSNRVATPSKGIALGDASSDRATAAVATPSTSGANGGAEAPGTSLRDGRSGSAGSEELDEHLGIRSPEAPSPPPTTGRKTRGAKHSSGRPTSDDEQQQEEQEEEEQEEDPVREHASPAKPGHSSARRGRAAASALCPRLSATYVEQGYTLTPPLAELQRMSSDELAAVTDFSVAREGFGSVKWLGRVDVRGLDVEKVVEINAMSIEVYKSEGDTPERGTKLNRDAICTIEHMEVPSHFASRARFVEWLRDEYTPKMDADFVHYDVADDTWTFKVKHFTKYGFGEGTPYGSASKPARPAKENVLVSEREGGGGWESEVDLSGAGGSYC